ncbi:unnamed protein product [Oppiella nova]|uniref:Uncharacterized protein n=1 Tax=Oppiella nova TaxID=334625 RepID=A0A7R9LXF7_9ACAR|nr:unnamed protein product [Oppiella nova]CAG2167943.1 unnamed protein product [Oppiella nova]
MAAHGIRSLPIYLRDIINGRIALKRIEKVLLSADRKDYIRLTASPFTAIQLKRATLAWDTAPDIKSPESDPKSVNNTSVQPSTTSPLTHCLINVSIDIPKGTHVGIIGSVGSGKTALLHSLLGQTRLISGRVGLRGSVAYVSQDPWILNASVRHNITFGNEFDSKHYYDSVRCCALSADISALVADDQTEIGERGVTLSGGQRQRISLARAYYANKDIYLLDDPLSAVDRTVGQHIFNNCIKNGLKDKTVLLVTHQTECLEAMDFVIFIREGRVVNTGAHNELYDSDDEYRQLIDSSVMLAYSRHQEYSDSIGTNVRPLDDRNGINNSSDARPLPVRSNSRGTTSESAFTSKSFHNSMSGQLIMDEKLGTGSISLDTYKSYVKSGGGLLIIAFLMGWLALQAMTTSFANWWLGYWMAQGDGNATHTGAVKGHDILVNPNLKYYQTIYGISVVVILCATLALGYVFTKVTLNASSGLHDQVFDKVLKSPLSFFDTVPIGRVLNVFTRDMDEMDTQVPQALDGFLQRLMVVLCDLFIIIVVYPWFLMPFSALVAVFWLIHGMFRGAMRDLKRLECGLRSPIYSHITATIEGLPTIKAFNKQNQFVDRFRELIDSQSAPNFLYYCSVRWLSTRIDIICVFVSLFAAIFAISGKDSVGAPYAALALVLSIQLSGLLQFVIRLGEHSYYPFSGLLQFVIRLGVDAETRFTSVERIHMYIKGLTPEEDVITTEANRKPIDDNWPASGAISFRDVSMRYRLGLPLALNGITLDIRPQEKIGLIGRTGAGKSSIASVLFRLVGLTSGAVLIDDVDIGSVPLRELRARISIIPQDPLLIRGSIRKNLDPLDEFDSPTIMTALDSVGMRHRIDRLRDGIETTVNETSGANFSAGERQLLCMARTLLRRTRIMILDESMARMDGETTNAIHQTIRLAFVGCTVIKIAHRLATVRDCHRVMVMSEGRVVEFDRPDVLAANPDSFFSKMHSNVQQI